MSLPRRASNPQIHNASSVRNLKVCFKLCVSVPLLFRSGSYSELDPRDCELQAACRMASPKVVASVSSALKRMATVAEPQ